MSNVFDTSRIKTIKSYVEDTMEIDEFGARFYAESVNSHSSSLTGVTPEERLALQAPTPKRRGVKNALFYIFMSALITGLVILIIYQAYLLAIYKFS